MTPLVVDLVADIEDPVQAQALATTGPAEIARAAKFAPTKYQ